LEYVRDGQLRNFLPTDIFSLGNFYPFGLFDQIIMKFNFSRPIVSPPADAQVITYNIDVDFPSFTQSLVYDPVISP